MVASRPSGNGARFLDEAHAFQGLTAVIVGRGVIGMARHQGSELAHRGLQIAGITVFHGEAVAGELSVGFCSTMLFRVSQTGACHACVTIPCKMACPYFYPSEARPGSPMLPLGDWWQGALPRRPGVPGTRGRGTLQHGVRARPVLAVSGGRRP